MRLFVAVALPPGAAEHLAAALGRDPDPRWHVTLAFLGEADPAPAAAALRQVPFTPFRLSLAGAGTFGGRVLWAGVGQGRAELTALAEAVAAACGVHEERPYQPHVTLRRGRDLDAGAFAPYVGPAGDVDRFGLYEGGGRHRLLARFPEQESEGSASNTPG